MDLYPLQNYCISTQYEEAAPGSRERFLDDYFADKQHLRQLEQEDQALRRDVAQGNLQLARRGQDRALVVGFGFGLLTAALALTGHDGVAIVTGGTTVVGIVGAFLASLRSTQSDRSERADAEASRQTHTDSKKKTHGK